MTSATFSTEHSVTHQIFYCLSHLCACLRRREISARSHPASGHHLSLGYLPASECTRADCTSRMTAGFSLQFSVTYLDHHAYHHGRKTVYDDVSESCMSFPCLPLSFISTISLYISCKASPFLKATVLYFSVQFPSHTSQVICHYPVLSICTAFHGRLINTQVKVSRNLSKYFCSKKCHLHSSLVGEGRI